MSTQDKKVIAGVYFKGPDLDPQSITAALGINPSNSHPYGETKRTSSGAVFSTKTGLWALVVDRDSAEVSDVLETLLVSLGKQSTLANLAGVREAYFDVFVALTSDDDGEGSCTMELNPAMLSELLSYGLPVRFTVTMGRS